MFPQVLNREFVLGQLDDLHDHLEAVLSRDDGEQIVAGADPMVIRQGMDRAVAVAVDEAYCFYGDPLCRRGSTPNHDDALS